MSSPATSRARPAGWSIRARLTALAAGVVAVALAIGGPLWVWGVEYRMLEDLRERDRLRATREAMMRSRGGGPGPLFPRAARAGPPRVDRLPDADLLSISRDGEPTFTGGDEGPTVELVAWLEAARGDAALVEHARTLGETVDDLGSRVRECVRERLFGASEGLPLRPPPEVHRECRATLEDAHAEAAERVRGLAWPQRVASRADGTRRLQTAVLVWLPDEEAPSALAVDASLESVDATTAALTRSLVLGGPLLLALVAGVAWFLVGRSLRVVGVIQRDVERIAFGTLDRRLEEPLALDEVSRLVDTLNRMLDRIGEGARRQREFIGDASHELRSPIASLRTQLEVALSRPEAADWPEVAAEAREEVIRLQKLVDDLLRIARLDESRTASAAPREEVDLDDVVRAESALVTDAKVGLSGVSPVRVRGVEADLRRLVRNLLENAARYGSGRIEVSLAREGNEARLEVEDDGPGIPVDRREVVFQRFTRLDESRSRAGGGAGLGLALARGVSEAHGGEIRVEDARLGGARLVVRLPVDESAGESTPL